MFPAARPRRRLAGERRPVLRGALAERLGAAHGGACARARADDAVMKYVDGADIAFYAAEVVTPDHIIRTKNVR